MVQCLRGHADLRARPGLREGLSWWKRSQLGEPVFSITWVRSPVESHAVCACLRTLPLMVPSKQSPHGAVGCFPSCFVHAHTWAFVWKEKDFLVTAEGGSYPKMMLWLCHMCSCPIVGCRVIASFLLLCSCLRGKMGIIS